MAANAQYMKEWRKTAEGKRALAHQRRRARAKVRAMKILISLHQREWDVLLAQAIKDEPRD